MSQEFNEAAPAGGVPGARGARSGQDGSRGGTGAPPSNTAPDNSIPSFQPFRWGIDSLYLSYPGELAEGVKANLRRLKQKAQGPEHEAAKAQLLIGDHCFEVKDKSSGLFAFTLVDGAFQIRLSAGASKTLPMAYVQVSSRLLTYKSVELIERELRWILQELGDVESPKVSRIDLFADFGSMDSMEAWDRDAWVTKASAVHQYAEGKTFTGWTVGAGGVLMARQYLKLLECQKSGKEYLLDLWRDAGWDGQMPVWRLEFEFRRECLAQLKLDGLSAVLGNLAGLWSYATTDWLTLRCPNAKDHTRSRWPIHPLWVALASIDWNAPGGPLSRTFTPTRAPSVEWLGARALSLLASMAALKGHWDFDVAAPDLLNAASNALTRRYSMSGISLDAGFFEMVEACNRKFNTRLNDFDPEPDPVVPPLQNPYYRGKQGMP
jgi:hypothetical protein